MKENKREFVNKITVKLTKFESERRKRLLSLLKRQGITFVIAILAIVGIFLKEHPVVSFFCMVITFFSCIAFFCNFSDDNKEFKKILKKECQSQILKDFDLDTLNGQPIPDSTLKKSNLFPLYSRTETDDVIQGIYKDTNFKIAETKLIAKGRKSERDVFNGVIIAFRANKKIKSETLVVSKGDKNIRNFSPANSSFLVAGLIIVSIVCTVVPWTFMIMDTIFSKFKLNFSLFSNIILIFPALVLVGVFVIYIYKQMQKMQKANLEDVNFEKSFDVYTEDQIEARYILTPTFMERLKSLNTSFGTKGVKCSFFDDYIMIAIPTKKDLFELGSLYQSLGSNKLVEEFYDELHSIYDMIDHLKLNEKIGL